MQRGGGATAQYDLGCVAALARVVDLDAALDGSADGSEMNRGGVLNECLSGRENPYAASNSRTSSRSLHGTG